MQPTGNKTHRELQGKKPETSQEQAAVPRVRSDREMFCCSKHSVCKQAPTFGGVRSKADLQVILRKVFTRKHSVEFSSKITPGFVLNLVAPRVIHFLRGQVHFIYTVQAKSKITTIPKGLYSLHST